MKPVARAWPTCCRGWTRWCSDMSGIPKIDLHMHSTVSDGTDTPEELLERVREAGIALFALTDHDAVKGYGRIRKALRPGDPALLSGVEFSCRDEEGKYHILGYHYDPESEAIRQIVEAGHQMRIRKTGARLEALRILFGFSFPEEEIRKLYALDNPGKPHLGNLMVKTGYAETKEQAISEYINKARIRSEYLRPEEAIRGILAGGGIPVLAHPAFGSGDQLIMGDEMDRRLRRLTEAGLQGLEGFYSGFTPKLRAEALGFAEKYGLYVTAGSDYHGKNKLVRLGDTKLNPATEMPGGMRRFLEKIGFNGWDTGTGGIRRQ